jgi:hypothetical protein
MKYAIAFLFLASVAQAQSFLPDTSKSKTRRLDFNPLRNERRTIEFDLTSGRPVVTSDITVPEGVGYIYIESGGKATLEYSRAEDVRMIRFWQQMPFAPIQPVVGF